MGKLTDVRVRKTAQTGLHNDGYGLYLKVTDGARGPGFSGLKPVAERAIWGWGHTQKFRSPMPVRRPLMPGS
jgi:hypothetical protein